MVSPDSRARPNGWIAAGIAAALFGCSTVYSVSVKLTSNAPILFSLTATLGVLWATHRHIERPQRRWAIAAFLCGLAAPATFAAGVLAGPWLVAYRLLVRRPAPRSRPRAWLAPLSPGLAGWALSVAVYVGLTLSASTHSTGAASFSIARGLQLSAEAVSSHLVPDLTSLVGLSLLLAISSGVVLVVCRRALPLGALLFFGLFVLANYLLVFAFREEHHSGGLAVSRYHQFPALGLAMFYSLLAGVAAPHLAHVVRRHWRTAAHALLLTLAVLNGWFAAFRISERLEWPSPFYRFAEQFRHAVTSHLEATASRPLALRDQALGLSVFLKVQQASYVARFVLPQRARDQLRWSARTDSSFRAYLAANRRRYACLVLATDWESSTAPGAGTSNPLDVRARANGNLTRPPPDRSPVAPPSTPQP